jgi:hypothetical protein
MRFDSTITRGGRRNAVARIRLAGDALGDIVTHGGEQAARNDVSHGAYDGSRHEAGIEGVLCTVLAGVL